MRIYIISGICFLGAMCLSNGIKAQSDGPSDSHQISIKVPSIALVDIEPTASKDITVAFEGPTEAGEGTLGDLTNNSLWLNYSSIVANGSKNKISVKIDQTVPGVDISVTAAAATTSESDGTLGTPSAKLTLTTLDQPIVTAIGSCYTGTGASNGHNLSYLLSVANYGALEAATTDVTVTYTIASEE